MIFLAVGNPVAVYWGENELGEQEFYAGLISEVNKKDFTVYLNFGQDELIPFDEIETVVPLTRPLKLATAYSKQDVAKYRLVVPTFTHGKTSVYYNPSTCDIVQGVKVGEGFGLIDDLEQPIYSVKNKRVLFKTKEQAESFAESLMEFCGETEGDSFLQSLTPLEEKLKVDKYAGLDPLSRAYAKDKETAKPGSISILPSKTKPNASVLVIYDSALIPLTMRDLKERIEEDGEDAEAIRLLRQLNEHQIKINKG